VNFFEDLFPGKKDLLFIKFQDIFVQKFVLRFPFGLNFPCILTSTSGVKIDDSRRELRCFHKASAYLTKICGIKRENPRGVWWEGGGGDVASLCRRLR